MSSPTLSYVNSEGVSVDEAVISEIQHIPGVFLQDRVHFRVISSSCPSVAGFV